MTKKGKLRAALDAVKGIDYKKKHQEKLVKESRKSKKSKSKNLEDDWEDVQSEDNSDAEAVDEESDGEESFKIDYAGIDDSESESSDEEDLEGLQELAEIEAAESAEASDDEDEEDIPMSDLEDLDDSDKEDMIPHQRLTINNTTALTAALNRIALPKNLPFSENQCITTEEPVNITDASDDLNRELAFYAQSLAAVKSARAILKAEGAPFSRPNDYFAEMVKADEHMAKIKAKLIDEAAGKRASADARKQRDLKKFGKQVQVAKQQERDKEKRQTMEKIKVLKRKRQSGDAPSEANEAELFDVALDDVVKEAPRRDRREKDGANKRQKKDQKYGHGGKKRFSKSGDAMSSGDLRGFSAKKMKGGAAKRPGKARRAGARK